LSYVTRPILGRGIWIQKVGQTKKKKAILGQNKPEAVPPRDKMLIRLPKIPSWKRSLVKKSHERDTRHRVQQIGKIKKE